MFSFWTFELTISQHFKCLIGRFCVACFQVEAVWTSNKLTPTLPSFKTVRSSVTNNFSIKTYGHMEFFSFLFHSFV